MANQEFPLRKGSLVSFLTAITYDKSAGGWNEAFKGPDRANLIKIWGLTDEVYPEWGDGAVLGALQDCGAAQEGTEETLMALYKLLVPEFKATYDPTW